MGAGISMPRRWYRAFCLQNYGQQGPQAEFPTREPVGIGPSYEARSLARYTVAAPTHRKNQWSSRTKDVNVSVSLDALILSCPEASHSQLQFISFQVSSVRALLMADIAASTPLGHYHKIFHHNAKRQVSKYPSRPREVTSGVEHRTHSTRRVPH